jgi:hypothetical protein
VKKRVVGQRKRKVERKHKWESCYRKSTNGKGQKKKGKATGGIITGVKLGLKKNDKKRENNKWWKIMIIYSKGMKTTRRQKTEKNVWLWEGTSTGK